MDQMVYGQKLAVERARFKQLQSQITPHFLYNSFYQLYRISQMGDMELSAELALQLSRYYQYITRDRDDIVPLFMEVEHAKCFAAIQNIRFGSRITCNFEEISPEYQELKVPKLILQPLLENAYKHGLEMKETPSWIQVSFRDEKDDVCLSVEDNGDALDEQMFSDLQARINSPVPACQTTGLLNINQRLVYLYGGQSRLRVRRAGSGGFCVEVCLSKTCIIPEKKKELNYAAFIDC
jgi:two-component system sensor histidine kinase YesM